MSISVPKWVSDVAIVGLIFSVGAYATRIELSLVNIDSEIEEIKTKRIAKIERQVVAIETAISIHHGRDWSDKVQKNTIMKVEDLEEKHAEPVRIALTSWWVAKTIRRSASSTEGPMPEPPPVAR